MLDQLEYGKHIGEFNTDGSIKTSVTHCPLSGKYVESAHSTRYRLAGTLYFYRVLTDAAPRGLSDAQRTALDEQVLAMVGKKTKVSKAPPADAAADDNQE